VAHIHFQNTQFGTSAVENPLSSFKELTLQSSRVYKTCPPTLSNHHSPHLRYTTSLQPLNIQFRRYQKAPATSKDALVSLGVYIDSVYNLHLRHITSSQSVNSTLRVARLTKTHYQPQRTRQSFWVYTGHVPRAISLPPHTITKQVAIPPPRIESTLNCQVCEEYVPAIDIYCCHCSTLYMHTADNITLFSSLSLSLLP
jgi:hypothetical protein